jgi:hypothetical protein
MLSTEVAMSPDGTAMIAQAEPGEAIADAMRHG